MASLSLDHMQSVCWRCALKQRRIVSVSVFARRNYTAAAKATQSNRKGQTWQCTSAYSKPYAVRPLRVSGCPQTRQYHATPKVHWEFRDSASKEHTDSILETSPGADCSRANFQLDTASRFSYDGTGTLRSGQHGLEDQAAASGVERFAREGLRRARRRHGTRHGSGRYGKQHVSTRSW